MKKRIAGGLLVAGVAYLFAWPVPIEPVAWEAPGDRGYTGRFATNRRLADLEQLPLAGESGPEDVAVDATGRIYAATHGGWIVRLDSDGGHPRPWVDTGGRPLGIEFDASGSLLVADALRGLLSVAPDGSVTLLADEAEGIPIGYADDVDVAADGRVYLSDASTRFAAADWQGSYEASLLDLMEHSSSGRVLVYDPETRKATTLRDGLAFPNGMAVSPDQSFLLVCEMGRYRILRHWLQGPRAGEWEPLIEELPGFPDNVNDGLDGRFWVALVSPRNALLDRLSGWPSLRKLVQRLPAFVRPAAVSWGHVFAIDAGGEVVQNLQDPSGAHPLITGAAETAEHLYLGSLGAQSVARLPSRAALGR